MGDFLVAIARIVARLLRPDPRCRCGHERADHLPTLLGKASCEIAGCTCEEYGEY